MWGTYMYGCWTNLSQQSWHFILVKCSTQGFIKGGGGKYPPPPLPYYCPTPLLSLIAPPPLQFKQTLSFLFRTLTNLRYIYMYMYGPFCKCAVYLYSWVSTIFFKPQWETLFHFQTFMCISHSQSPSPPTHIYNTRTISQLMSALIYKGQVTQHSRVLRIFLMKPPHSNHVGS